MSDSVRAGLYVRVSTEMQAKSGVSVDEQRQRLTEGCQRRGWEIAKVYVDDGYSAHDMDRPDVCRCIADVAAGKLDALYALDVDRTHRNERNRRISRPFSASTAWTWSTSWSRSTTACP